MEDDGIGIIEIAAENLNQTAERLNLDQRIYHKIAQPKERIEISLTPVLHSGKQLNLKAFVVRHNDTLGPSKGGIRMTADVTLNDIVGLSMDMTWKNALIGVPFGGGKSGLCCPYADISEDDKEVIIRAFTRGVLRHIGPELYIPAPDIGTNETDMGHIRDCISYSRGTSITNGCYVTGKPVILGGILGRREATGRGVVYSILAACEKLDIDVSACKVAIQGAGNVGSVAAQTIAESGASVVAISDVDGGLYNPSGLDVDSILSHLSGNKGLSDYRGEAEKITNEELLEIACDILIPAATQAQITAANADKIKAKMIAEGANSPTTPEGDEILNDRGIFVIPDILCNAGGVFVSYLEYSQETQRSQMTAEEVDSKLRRRMSNRVDEVLHYSTERKLSMRKSAMDIAVSRIAEGIMARGLLP